MRPDKVEALCSHGNALRDYYRGRPLRDLKYNAYDKALAIPPRAPDILNYRGIALRDLDRPAEALASFERALAIQGDHVEALKNRDNLLRELGHRTEALASRDGQPTRNPMSQQYPDGLPVRAAYGYGYQSAPPVSVQQPSTIEKHEMALAVARAFEPKQVVGF